MKRLRHANGRFVTRDLLDAFTERVRKTEGCWLWTGTKKRRGYGVIRGLAAHRLSWQIHRGEIGPGLCVCHVCDNPSCVNPEHLFLGTVTDNNHDRHAKGRTKLPPQKGERNPQSKLTTAQVESIRSLRGVLPQAAVARLYGITQGCVSQIQIGIRWQHLDAGRSLK